MCPTTPQLCIFPFNISNVTYTDCNILDNTEMCRTMDGYLHQCTPQIESDVDSTRCVDQERIADLLANDLSSNITTFVKCITLQVRYTCTTRTSLVLLHIVLGGQSSFL